MNFINYGLNMKINFDGPYLHNVSNNKLLIVFCIREPLVRRQGSQVSMRVGGGSASWLSSHGRGLGPRDALKKDSRGLSRGAAGNPRFPRLLPGTLGNFPGCL